MDSSDLEEDIEQYIENVLNEEEQELQKGSEQENLGKLVEEPVFEEEAESVPQQEKLRPGERRQKGRRRIVAGIAIALIALIGIGAGYLYLKREKIAVSPSQEREPGQTVSISMPEEEVLVLEPFVIPTDGNKDFTYLFLSISIKLPNKEVRREVTEKGGSLRGIVYDTLAREIANTRKVPPLESLKEFIIRGVNGALSSGKISDVFISEFLAV
jgi:flagellar basal body-associated protein FliL